MTFGLLVSYLVARQNEVKAIRIVLAVGKLATFAPELIRERLRRLMGKH